RANHLATGVPGRGRRRAIGEPALETMSWLFRPVIVVCEPALFGHKLYDVSRRIEGLQSAYLLDGMRFEKAHKIYGLWYSCDKWPKNDCRRSLRGQASLHGARPKS